MSLRKNSKVFNIISLVILSIIMIVLVIQAGYSAEIRGIVQEEKSGKILPAANVYFKGTNYGSSTNEKGEFKITDIPKGNYELIIKYIGYKTYKDSLSLYDTSALVIDADLEKTFIWMFRK